MKQQPQGLRSTKSWDMKRLQRLCQHNRSLIQDVYLRAFNSTKKSINIDQICHFPITSSHGNKYLMIAVKLDGNYIADEPLQSCNAQDLMEAYLKIIQWWKATGVICPNWHMLENEAPAEFKQAVCENGCNIECVPPDIFHCNTAKYII